MRGAAHDKSGPLAGRRCRIFDERGHQRLRRVPTDSGAGASLLESEAVDALSALPYVNRWCGSDGGSGRFMALGRGHGSADYMCELA